MQMLSQVDFRRQIFCPRISFVELGRSALRSLPLDLLTGACVGAPRVRERPGCVTAICVSAGERQSQLREKMDTNLDDVSNMVRQTPPAFRQSSSHLQHLFAF